MLSLEIDGIVSRNVHKLNTVFIENKHTHFKSNINI